MAQGGVLGLGTKVGFSLTSPVTWVAVPEITRLDPPGLAPSQVSVTVHGTSAFRRYMRGLIDVTDLTMTVLADLSANSVHLQLRTHQLAGTQLWWRIEIPANREMSSYVAVEFQGVVQDWKPAVPIDDAQTIDISVKFSGSALAIYAPGSSQIP